MLHDHHGQLRIAERITRRARPVFPFRTCGKVARKLGDAACLIILGPSPQCAGDLPDDVRRLV